MRILIKVVIVILGVLVSVSCKDRNNEKDIFPVVEVDLFNPVEEVPVSSFIDTLISVRLELPKPLFLLQMSCLPIQISMFMIVNKK